MYGAFFLFAFDRGIGSYSRGLQNEEQGGGVDLFVDGGVAGKHVELVESESDRQE